MHVCTVVYPYQSLHILECVGSSDHHDNPKAHESMWYQVWRMLMVYVPMLCSLLASKLWLSYPWYNGCF